MKKVWSSWIPGVLSNKQLRDLAEESLITGVDHSAIGPSAIDLHLSDDCYRLVKGSVKPSGEDFIQRVVEAGLGQRIEPGLDRTWTLRPKETYVFRLRERLEGLREKPVWGQATAKSSVGRVDVLARLIVDGMLHYERFHPEYVSPSAAMFLEVTPITFPVRVRPGDSLNQLRFFYGDPRECELRGQEIGLTCLNTKHFNLTVDLSAVEVFGVQGCGFRAAPVNPNEAIPLWKEKGTVKPDPSGWWELVRADVWDRLRIQVDRFYILRSKERLRVPSGIAVYARAIDEEIGEMRIHYAGFAHPFFGWERPDDKMGTPLIFEVRGHSVPVSLRHGEILARLQFFRMSEDPDKDPPSYNQQELNLSNYFADWSSPPRLADEDSN